MGRMTHTCIRMRLASPCPCRLINSEDCCFISARLASEAGMADSQVLFWMCGRLWMTGWPFILEGNEYMLLASGCFRWIWNSWKAGGCIFTSLWHGKRYYYTNTCDAWKRTWENNMLLKVFFAWGIQFPLIFREKKYSIYCENIM